MYFRLKKRRDFVAISKRGHKFVANNFILLLQKRDDVTLSPRIGVVASKKVGNAVKRNRAKRILRNLARIIPSVEGGNHCDYVIIARFSILNAPYISLEQDMFRAVKVLIRKHLK